MQSLYKLVKDVEPLANLVLCRQSKEYCGECEYKREGWCHGCSHEGHYQYCRQRACVHNCTQCSGHKTNQPGLCCHSLVRDVALSIVRQPNRARRFPTHAPLSFPHVGVPVVTGSIQSESPYDDSVKVVAVPVAAAYSTESGWFSKDFRDYLKLRSDQKLVLLTTALDMVLESLWEKEDYGTPDELKARGFDYWMPVVYSSYVEQSYMEQVFNALRSYRSLEECQAHFVPYNGNLRDTLMRQALLKSPNLIFNGQFFMRHSVADRDFFLRLVFTLGKMLPTSTTFSFVGPGTPSAIMNLKKVAGSRKVYIFSSTPWLSGMRGNVMDLNGSRIKKAEMSKLECIKESQRVFIEMCEKRPADYGL